MAVCLVNIADTPLKTSQPPQEILAKAGQSQAFVNMGWQLKNTLKIWLLTITAYFIWRLAFLLAYQPPNSDSSALELVSAFLIGMRFDNAIFFILNAIPLLLLFIPVKNLLYQRVTNVLFFLAFVLSQIASLSVFVYFAFAQKHPTIELALIFKDFTEIMLMGFVSYWYVPLGYLAVVWGGWILWRRLIPLLKPKDIPPKFHPIKTAVTFIALVFLIIISIRGGLQTRPLRPSMAFQNENMFLGNLALNGVYTSVTALFKSDKLPVPRQLDATQIEYVQSRLFSANEGLIDPKYPFYRRYLGKTQQKLNVVLFIMESWSAADIGALGSKMKATPFFDSIAAQGALFTEAYATNSRSIESLPSIISSIPSTYGVTYITSVFQQNNQRSLAAVFAKHKYNSFFAYAARKGSMGFDAYAKQTGFRNIITKDSFDGDTPQDGTWGIYDEYTFIKMNEMFAHEKGNFVAAIYSLHPHPPYHLPNGNTKFKNTGRDGFLNALHYSDQALAAFFKHAKDEDYFKNTIFIITADHAFEQKPGRDSFRVPLLFYSPGNIKPARNNRIASQLDVLPSIISLTGINEPFSASGKSLFDNTEAFALFETGSLMGYAEGGYVLLADADQAKGLFNMVNDPYFEKNLMKADQSTLKQLSQKYFNFISLLNKSILQNTFAPAY